MESLPRRPVDLLIDGLAASLREACAERDGYRLLAVQALHHIHAQQAELDVVRARYDRLLAEFRDQRKAAA